MVIEVINGGIVLCLIVCDMEQEEKDAKIIHFMVLGMEMGGGPEQTLL